MMKRHPNTTCIVCKKNIYRRPLQIRSGNVYCSLVCCGKSQQVQKVCSICNKVYTGTKQTCSHACANSARKGITYTRENKFNKASKGTLLKEKVANRCNGTCERCGENNYSILQVHHKKERYRGGTDTISNLKLLCPNCHMTHHLGSSLFQNKKNAKVQQSK